MMITVTNILLIRKMTKKTEVFYSVKITSMDEKKKFGIWYFCEYFSFSKHGFVTEKIVTVKYSFIA